MAAHWEQISGAPPANYDRTDSGWLYFIEIKQYQYGKIALVDGGGLIVASNAAAVVPNDSIVFKGRTGLEKRRTIEFYGLTEGTSMIEARNGEGGSLEIVLQVHVKPAPGTGPIWIQLDSPQTALNAERISVPYQMKNTFKIGGGEKAVDVLKKVPAGTKHLTISCHGKPEGILELGESFNKDNVDTFATLKDIKLLVIWLGACSVAGTPEGEAFCQKIAKNAGCYLRAPAITCPFVKPPIGQVELMKFSKYIDPEGKTINEMEFLKKQSVLGFKILS